MEIYPFLFFTASPEAVIKKQYYLLGQISAITILLIGHGPPSFHPDVVHYLFHRQLTPKTLKNIQNCEFEQKLATISNRDNSSLLEANIVSSKSKVENVNIFTRYFCFLMRTRTAAVDRLIVGLWTKEFMRRDLTRSILVDQ